MELHIGRWWRSVLRDSEPVKKVPRQKAYKKWPGTSDEIKTSSSTRTTERKRKGQGPVELEKPENISIRRDCQYNREGQKDLALRTKQAFLATPGKRCLLYF